MMKSSVYYLLLLLLAITFSSTAQQPDVFPPNWWVGMKNTKLQIMVHSDKIGNISNIRTDYPGVSIKKINRPENKNYVFIDLNIDPGTKPGMISFYYGIDFNATIGNKTATIKKPLFQYYLKSRRKGKSVEFAQGVTSKDFIYLIMPDRFANGDTSNDLIAGMRDQSLNRDTVFNRHGGDLQGIINHLDYLKDLGVTSIWLNPIWENDMPERTEHGYAFTNHYKVDPRLGGNKAYAELVNASHKKGMKVIQDAVYNHVGSYHFTVTAPPMKDWLNQWDKYTNTSYKDQTLFDPYASNKDGKQMSDGWFTTQMPDLNQKNPYVANFLIQHALWSVEEFGIDGWRIDTYAYNDLGFMNRCNKALMDEYPNITLFGETWVHGVPNQSFFCDNNYNIKYKSNLQATTDFQTLWGITAAMNEDFGWTSGVNKLYTTLSQDFVYKDPSRQVVFLDNHDMARFYSVVGEDINKYISSICWVMTTRGIPQMYYSSELATTGTTSPSDGYVRLDFPGGWKSDSVNKFIESGRNEKDQMIFNTWKILANYRKSSSALTTGKFMQYLPDDGVYTYFRYDNKQTIMVSMNTSKTKKTINLKNYDERTKGFSTFRNIFNNNSGNLTEIELAPYHTIVYELLP
jgi:glycosidase